MTSTPVGTCIVCQREIAVRKITGEGALHSHLLVHHGYNRPGIGCIVGDCFAVSMPPHELSDYAAREYLEFSRKQLQRERELLTLLDTRTVACVYQAVRVPVPTTLGRSITVLWGRQDPGWTDWDAPYYTNETDPERRAIYERVCRANADRVRGQIRMLEIEILRMERAVNAWTPKPLGEREKVVPNPSRRRRRMRFARGA